MGISVVVLNGMPGAGKTTLAGPLADELDAVVIGKDAIKEALADLIGVRVPTSRLGALSSDVMWRLAGMVDGLVLVENFWATGRDEDHLRTGLHVSGAERAIEVWCDIPIEVARQRFLSRPRHVAHQDAARLDEWETMAARARPCSGQPTMVVSTVDIVEVPALASRIRTLLADESARVSGADPSR